MSVRQLRWSADLHRVLARYGDGWVSLAYSPYSPPQEVSDDVVRAAVPLIPAIVWRTGDPLPIYRVVVLNPGERVLVWNPATTGPATRAEVWEDLLSDGPVVQIADYYGAVADDEARRSL